MRAEPEWEVAVSVIPVTYQWVVGCLGSLEGTGTGR